ncbi:MAG TPA: hypothetical protein VHA09_03435 [Nitrososphaera sp.]|nr:hypothetical protein [Nitrososphaera sp.]
MDNDKLVVATAVKGAAGHGAHVGASCYRVVENFRPPIELMNGAVQKTRPAIGKQWHAEYSALSIKRESHSGVRSEEGKT